MSAGQVLTYHAMRMAWCRAALFGFFKRWAVYLLVGLAVLAGNHSAFIDAASALAAWAVLPVFYGAAHLGPDVTANLPAGVSNAVAAGLAAGMTPDVSRWAGPWAAAAQAALVLAAYVLVAGALVFALGPMLWPHSWAETERALPLAATDLQRSDGWVTLLALLPLFAVYCAGATVWLLRLPPWLRGHQLAALSLLFLSALGGLLLGWHLLGVRRRTAAGAGWAAMPRALSRARRIASGDAIANTSTNTNTKISAPTDDAPAGRVSVSPAKRLNAGRMHGVRALVLLPLWRGPAQRSGKAIVLTGLALLSCALGLCWWPLAGGWWLALFALVAQLMTTRLNVLVRTELGALHRACTALPLSARALALWRDAVVLFPLVLGGVGLWVLLATLAAPAAPNWVVVGLFGAFLVAGNWVLMRTANAPARRFAVAEPDPSARIAGWLLVLVIAVALATEVFP